MKHQARLVGVFHGWHVDRTLPTTPRGIELDAITKKFRSVPHDIWILDCRVCLAFFMGCPFARDQDAVKNGQAMAMYWSNGNRCSERDRATGCGTFWILAIARAALAGEWIFFEADYFLKMLLI